MVEAAHRAKAIEHGQAQPREVVGIRYPAGCGGARAEAQLGGAGLGQGGQRGDGGRARHGRCAPAAAQLGAHTRHDLARHHLADCGDEWLNIFGREYPRVDGGARIIGHGIGHGAALHYANVQRNAGAQAVERL